MFFLSLFLKKSIKSLPPMAFENLNSLETLSIQNNKLSTIPEDVMEPIIDTLRVVDIMGEFLVALAFLNTFLDSIKVPDHFFVLPLISELFFVKQL